MSSVGRETARSWYALDVVVEAPAREAIEYGLMEADALGTETNDDGDKSHVRGYFASAPEIESVKTQLLEALSIYNLLPAAMSDLRLSEVADRDWLAEWKKSWQPVQVGRFIIAPPWLSEPRAVATGIKRNERIG
jgi:ribosomal protein L11 methylase PrmA